MVIEHDAAHAITHTGLRRGVRQEQETPSKRERERERNKVVGVGAMERA